MSMPAALRRRREFQGPVLLSYSFRPFFLGASLWAALGVLLWLPQYFGEFRLPTHLGALDWHVHEMLYGYAPATIAGFLLTAIPNWTGRLPVNGPSLGALVKRILKDVPSLDRLRLSSIDSDALRASSGA